MTHNEIATDAGAAAAVFSPLWLPWLHEVSEVAAMVVPILGVIWLILQITLKIYAFYRRRKS
jgi:hypothetical protein